MEPTKNFFKSFDIKVYNINNSKDSKIKEILNLSVDFFSAFFFNKTKRIEMTILTVESIISIGNMTVY